MREIIIHVFESELSEGYVYNIYGNKEDFENCNDIDGGLCISTMKNALCMAFAQAEHLIRK